MMLRSSTFRLWPATLGLALLLAAGTLPAAAAGWDAVSEALGRSGTLSGDIYKVSFPRTDLHVSVDGTPIKTGLALGGWAAFTHEGGATVVDGDFALLPEEINNVVSALQVNGIDVTALHNHLIMETPHVMYLHFFGQGDAAALARGVKAAIATTATPPPAPSSGPPGGETPAWARAIEQSLGHSGSVKGGVLHVGIPRAEKIHERGAMLPPSMGMANGFAFQEAAEGKVAATGDFILTGDEVNPVLRELRAGGILVTALHNHLIRSTPALYFMHFWGTGDPAQIGQTLRNALAHVRTRKG